MNCGEVQHLLHPYSDGELDLVRQLQIEDHLTDCGSCAEQEKTLRSLRAVISSPSLYHQAPATLRTRVQRAIAPAPRRRPVVRLAALAAGVLLLIGTATLLGIHFYRSRNAAEDRLAEWVVAGHVRSLQVDHLTDVISADCHIVKPWFRGKLDFSPEVPDLSQQGYALSGGRLDYLDDRAVAALVYHRRLHVINVFTWPAARDQQKAMRELARQGFHVRTWQRAGMTYWAISDLNDLEFDDFVRLFQEHTGESRP